MGQPEPWSPTDYLEPRTQGISGRPTCWVGHTQECGSMPENSRFITGPPRFCQFLQNQSDLCQCHGLVRKSSTSFGFLSIIVCIIYLSMLFCSFPFPHHQKPPSPLPPHHPPPPSHARKNNLLTQWKDCIEK